MFLQNIRRSPIQTVVLGGEVHLKAYKRLYDQAESVDDIMRIQQEISRLGSEINQLKNESTSLNEGIKYTDFTIFMEEVTDFDANISDGPEFGKQIVASAKESIYGLKTFILFLILSIIKLWWLILLVFFGIKAFNKNRKKFLKQEEERKKQRREEEERMKKKDENNNR